MTTPVVGRRERKNAQTRRALREAALRLFLERGYDQVSVKEIADAADISVPTLFNHVPEGKEALMFDNGAERHASLLAAVRERPAGQSVMAALRQFMSGRGPFVADPAPEFRRRTELIQNTPALRDYSRKLWIRCENDLAAAIAAEIGRPPDDMTARAAARFVLEIPQFASAEPDPAAALNAIFDLLEHGLPAMPCPVARSVKEPAGGGQVEDAHQCGRESHPGVVLADSQGRVAELDEPGDREEFRAEPPCRTKAARSGRVMAHVRTADEAAQNPVDECRPWESLTAPDRAAPHW